MIELRDCCFRKRMGCGGDVLALYGRVYGHPNYADGDYIFVSTPKELSVDKDEVVMHSGRTYKLINPSPSRGMIFEEIQKVIERGGYEVW